MPRHKAAINCTVLPWASAKADNKEKRFLQLGNSLLFNEQFHHLSAGAKHLYICMMMESGGHRDFLFPQSAAKKYGIAPASFWRYVAELADAKFIRVQSMKNLRQKNEYAFSSEWKIATEREKETR